MTMATTKTTKKDIKKEFVEKILEHIEKTNTLPWDSGLLNDKTLLMPINFITGKRYRGINIMFLWMQGGGTQEYATFKQVQEKGGHIKKGSKGLPVVFYKPLEIEDKETGETKTIPMLKKFTVFKVSDCEGVEGKRELKTVENKRYEDIDTAIKLFFKNTRLSFKEESCVPHYTPGTHTITISNINEYKTSDMYYQTLFHEMAHSTGDALKRDMRHKFGTKMYSKEEVVAEFTSMLLCYAFGVKNSTDNSAEYIKGWSRKLRENPDWLISGASKADKAFEYIIANMGLTIDESTGKIA